MSHKNKLWIVWCAVTLLWVIPSMITAKTPTHAVSIAVVALLLFLIEFKITRNWK